MIYYLDISNRAEKEIEAFKKSNPAVFAKTHKLLKELAIHPFTGTGKPERLKHRRDEWSRRISGKHRLVYTVNNETIIVEIISVSSHYEDK
ncbi:MAG: Txe/YoeB family addiction module toxin [Tannerella sp.]|jgi:toxin YoeB|nr:Txe/YoeB family addiction module toxin [Tannerella sp.]